MLTVSVGLTITVIGLGLTALILAALARQRGKLLDRITQTQRRLPLSARSPRAAETGLPQTRHRHGPSRTGTLWNGEQWAGDPTGGHGWCQRH